MKPLVVVGSGASGVHFALTALERGRQVLMLDVGHERTPQPAPEASFTQLKDTLADPVEYLLGNRFEGVTFPGGAGEYYGIPPSKSFVFAGAGEADPHGDGFSPLFSFARGGLAEAWTAGVYPFNRDETADFPFDHADLHAAYGEVARRIGVTGTHDDLSRFMPEHDHQLEPLQLDRSSTKLLGRYERVRHRLNERLGCYMGRSRLATLTQERAGRKPCTYLGRCLFGCPHEALYTPSVTLAECLAHPGFRYVPGVFVTHFEYGGDGRIRTVVAAGADGSGPHAFPVDDLALAAGTLSSARIFLNSVYRETGEILRLPGLMDNRQVLVPFVNTAMLGVPYDPASYQYHLLGMGLEQDHPAEYVHCQITTLTTGMVHPVLQSMPCDMRTAAAVFRQVRSSLGVVNVNFHDTRRDDNFVTLEAREGKVRLALQYRPAADEPARIDRALRRLRKALRELRCMIPPGMEHVRPMGASVHYSGTFPMQTTGGALSTTPEGRSREFSNLLFVDGSTFPFLPAKNITFTLMANAVRIGRSL
ncbi:MAG TPA: GMC oxidoreductase [Longimicrobiales bacterium]|nr:GMC oxidoreductase [Longimicrobiales bacterium]